MTSSENIEQNYEWTPKCWVAIVWSLIFYPLAMLYVERPRLFWIYFLISIPLTAIEFSLISRMPEGHWYQYVSILWLLNISCAVHAYYLAKNYSSKKDRKWYSRWWIVPVFYAAILLPVFAFRLYVAEPFSIPAGSMEPSFNVGDHILVKKWGFTNKALFRLKLYSSPVDRSQMKRGSIYVFFPPHKPDTYFIKRLIGLPGDTIQMKDELLYVNGEKLVHELVSQNEVYSVYTETIDDISYEIQYRNKNKRNTNFSMRVPEGHYFFMGDSRDNSADSRYWGPVSGESIVAEYWRHIPYDLSSLTFFN